MTTKKIPMLTDISEEDRKSVEDRLRRLQGMMRYCEGYLRNYVEGKQNAIKFLSTVADLHEEVKQAAKELMQVHDLPNFPGLSNL
jgi:hypothetical protein